MFASSFGVAKELDIFFVSTIFPVMISTSFYYISQNYYIPTFNRIKTDNPEMLRDYLKSALLKNFLLSALISLLLLVFSGVILSSFLGEIGPEELRMAENIFYIYIFSLPFSLVISVLIAWQYFQSRYLQPLISQIWPNLFIIFFVFISAGEYGVYSIAIGYLTGLVLQFINMFLVSKDDLRFGKLKMTGSFLKLSVIPAFAVVVLIEVVGQFNPMIDRAFFAKLEEGSISALNYSNNLMLLPVSMVAMAFSTALFPKVSEYFAQGDFDSLRNKLGQSIELMAFFFLPLMVVFLLFPGEVVKLIYVNASFSANDLQMVSGSFYILILSLVFYSVYAVFSKFLYGINEATALLLINLAAVLLKFVINYFFVDEFNYLALAASTSVSYLFLFTFSFFVLFRKIGGLKRPELINIFKIFISLSITIIIGLLISNLERFSGAALKIGLLLFLLVVYLLVNKLLKLRILKLLLNRETGFGKN